MTMGVGTPDVLQSSASSSSSSAVFQLIQHDDYAFSIDLQDGYLHIPIVYYHHHFLDLFGTICHIN